jgi:chromosome segregation ATPase
MIEPIMYFGIGFLFATLLAMVTIPLVHGRAVRLTMRRLEAATPLSMAEIQADKDQLRAEFAMSTRRLEMSVEQMKVKTTSQLAELGKKSEAINRLKVELGEKTTAIFALEARDRALKDQLKTTEEEYAVKTAALRDAERTLADKQAELGKLTSSLDERSVVTDSQRIELVALRTQIESLKNRVGEKETEVDATQDRLERERRDAAKAAKELLDERRKVENLATRVGELERQLIAQTTEAEILGRRVQELEGRLGQQGRLIAEREYEAEQLQAQIDTALNTELHLRSELAAAEGRHNEATGNLKAEKALREKELEQARAERVKLQSEIAAMKREAEATWAAERVENALLRERINDVAAEVAKLTVVLEGPNSPIEAILAGDALHPHGSVNGNGTNGEGVIATSLAPESSRGNLAERMRALQARASRVTTNS